MASYAALLSVMHTLNHIKKHPQPPISIDPKQMDHLTKNLTFLLNFLERFSGEDDDLESRIAAAAYAAEDVIESHIVDHIHTGSDMISSVDLYQGLERVIQVMDLIKKEVTVKEKMEALRHGKVHKKPASVRAASTRQSSIMVEFDGVFINDVLDMLTGRQRYRQVVPVVGMGGIGKTSFARNVYINPLIVEHFDILVWVTISQEYSASEILWQVLSLENKVSDDELGASEILSQVLSLENKVSDDELGELGVKVYKKLWGRRYLIVMDDVWSIEVWDRVKIFFPDNNNGSRVMITTRMSKLAFDLSGSQVFEMSFLDEDKSWALLCKTVFGKEACPMGLQYIAKEIARSCRGLPLSIVAIGGLLTNSNMSRTYWECILENISSFINLENDEYCLKVLHTSYKELPIHLKSCFLYLGNFPEDDEISVSELIKLWVAEGILRPSDDKRLEDVAEEYLMELIDRNLVVVYKLRWNGKVKLCKIHDLLRDLCLKEVKKQRFLCAMKNQQDFNIPECMNMERRICIHDKTEKGYSSQFYEALKSASLTRSLILPWGWHDLYSSLNYRLLRVFSEFYEHKCLGSLESIFQNVNLRYLTVSLDFPQLSAFPSSWIFLWNLQTIKVDSLFITSQHIIAPSEIWDMLLLRHVMIPNLLLPDPRCRENYLPLEDLQTLSCVTSFKCSKEVIKIILNVKILKIKFEISSGETEYHKFSHYNFGHLTNLETLNLDTRYNSLFDREFQRHMGQNLSFPHSLRKLTLSATMLDWEDCMKKIGSLPFLEFLSLNWRVCWGPEWETVEGQFCSLKFLQLHFCHGLRYWRTDDAHFPRLEHLLLEGLDNLEEIPSSIGDIPTLKSIRLVGCSESAARIKKMNKSSLGT